MGEYAITGERVGVDFQLVRAVFLDRDGVINRAIVRDSKPFPARSITEFEILPDVSEACARLKAAGFLLIVATNQPDVGRGTLERATVEGIHSYMCDMLPIDRVEVSYASGREQPPDQDRKPRPGMLLRAARELDIDLGQSWMIGDRSRDIACGDAAGCRTVFIDYGYDETLTVPPNFRAKSLLAAAEIVLTAK